VTGGDFWAGTSMASPYATGLCALLISNVLQQDPGAKVRACDVRQALRLSGRPLEGFTPLDYGYGVPDLPKAALMLDKLRADAGDDPLINYDISTPTPFGYEGEARAAYWRSTWFPADEPQAFTIEPVFAPVADMSSITSFTRRYELRSATPWCQLEQESVYLRSEQSANVYVRYDAEALTDPGLHVGVVEALYDGEVAFRLLNNIIVPYRFSADGNYRETLKDQEVKGWAPKRYFVAVPPGASAMVLTLRAPEGVESRALFDRIFNPRGKQFGKRARLDTAEGVREAEWRFDADLTPGVWEIDVLADQPDKTWPYELEIKFHGVTAEPAEIVDAKKTKPAGDVTFTNVFEEPLYVTAEGQIEGFRQHEKDEFKGLKDTLEYSLKLDDRFNRVRLRLELEPEDYATVTDIAAIVTDANGEVVFNSGFDDRRLTDSFSTHGKSSLTLTLTAGFAQADDKRKTPIDVKIDYLFDAPVDVKVTQGDSANATLVPSLPAVFEYRTREELKDAPKGTAPVGYIWLKERSTGEIVVHVPIDLAE